MCGIVGVIGPPEDRADGVVGGMLATLVHRGPDGSGLAGRGPCRLGLTRLAIIDVPAPPDPFVNEDGTILCVCNGQIYNGRELREDLERKGHRFATRVDTEVIPHLWEEEGPDLVHRLEGMFAFALWDGKRETLMLGRDRAGEKPLFYWRDGERLLFASEIRALLAHPAVRPHLDPLAVVQYLTHGFFPAPLSPLSGIRKLPAAHFLIASSGRVEVSRYWDLAEHFSAPGSSGRRSAGEIASELDARMMAAFRRRSWSDVPFGIFLSGGIDSSTALSYLTEIHGTGIPVFTLGHTDSAFDEAGFAAETARFFDAELHPLVVSRAELEDGLRGIGRGMDEPLGDASTIPTYLLSQFARRRVKVVLSGEGADELFGGYPTYLGHRVADRLRRVPAPLRRALVGGLRRLLPVKMGNVGLDYLAQQFAAGLERPRIERHRVWFGSIGPERMADLLSPSFLLAIDAGHAETPSRDPGPDHRFPDPLAELLYTDFTMYLQDDLLTKIDRATMMASLEGRAPFLDRELAEFVAGIPSRHKVRGLTTKIILRRTVRGRLPEAVLSRRKRGFNIPFSRWVLEGLGNELRRRFSRERVEARGLFSWAGIERLIDEHMTRRADHRKPLFTLLALDLWCDRTFGEGAHVPVADAESGHQLVPAGPDA